MRLADIAEECHRLLEAARRGQGPEIVEEFAADLPQVWADQRAMRQICLNLMSNALKFTPKGGRITLTVGAMPRWRPVPDRARHRPRHPRGGDPQGDAGLRPGLAGAPDGRRRHRPRPADRQNLIELHGGTFELQSELRKGTEAIVVLPEQRVLRAMAPLQPLGQERHRPGRRATAAATGAPACRQAPETPTRPRIRCSALADAVVLEQASAYIRPVAQHRHAQASRIHGIPLHQGLRHRPGTGLCARLRPLARRDRALERDVAPSSGGASWPSCRARKAELLEGDAAMRALDCCWRCWSVAGAGSAVLRGDARTRFPA